MFSNTQVLEYSLTRFSLRNYLCERAEWGNTLRKKNIESTAFWKNTQWWYIHHSMFIMFSYRMFNVEKYMHTGTNCWWNVWCQFDSCFFIEYLFFFWKFWVLLCLCSYIFIMHLDEFCCYCYGCSLQGIWNSLPMREFIEVWNRKKE